MVGMAPVTVWCQLGTAHLFLPILSQGDQQGSSKRGRHGPCVRRDEVLYLPKSSNDKARQLRTPPWGSTCRDVSGPYNCFMNLVCGTDMDGALLDDARKQEQRLLHSRLTVMRGQMTGTYPPSCAANFDPILHIPRTPRIFRPVCQRAFIFLGPWHGHRVPLQNGRRIGGPKGQSESESRDANLHCEECDASSLEWVTPRGIKMAWSLSWKLGVEGK